jgi:hypothetical protein
MPKGSEKVGSGLGDANGLSWSCNYARILGAQEPAINPRERTIIRKLAKRVAEIAADPAQEEKKRLWLRHNALGQTRPLIFADPENAWYEIIMAAQLCCEGNVARLWEFRLLKEIYWAERIRDDRVIEPAFTVYQVFEEGGWGLDVRIIGGEDGGAYRWEPPLGDYRDLEKPIFRHITINAERTRRLHDLAHEVLGDILAVRLEGAWWWSHGMTSSLILLRGFKQVLFDMYDHPNNLHRLMAFLRDDNLARLDFLERHGLLSLNNGGDFVGTGAMGGQANSLPKVSTIDG